MTPNRQVANSVNILAHASISFKLRDNPNDPYTIIEFNPDDLNHSATITEMDKDSRALQFLNPPKVSSAQEIDDFLRLKIDKKIGHRLILAVASREDKSILGWIQCYSADPELFKGVKKQIHFPDDAQIFEISYLKNFKANKPGVAVNGVKQVLKIIQEANHTQIPIYAVASTNPLNIASEKVLEKNGFTVLPNEINYDGESDHAWVKKL